MISSLMGNNIKASHDNIHFITVQQDLMDMYVSLWKQGKSDEEIITAEDEALAHDMELGEWLLNFVYSPQG